LYCNYHTFARETPINGTCVPNDADCGSLGKACCVETTVTFEASDYSWQRVSCDLESNLSCNLVTLTCEEDLMSSLPNTTSKISELCGMPYGACFPAFTPSNPNGTIAGPEDFPDINCDKGCPENYFCAVVERYRTVEKQYSGEPYTSEELFGAPACLGPVDPECGKIGKPCCPWRVEDADLIDGELHCDERDSDGQLLQCRSLYDLNGYTPKLPMYSGRFQGFHAIKAAIESSTCTRLVECGSENNTCCHDYQDRYIYTNPISPHASSNTSLLCADGLYCHYQNFTFDNPQGTCISNTPDCGLEEGSACCIRSITTPVFSYREDLHTVGSEEFYCRNSSLVCSMNRRISVLQTPFTGSCILPSEEEDSSPVAE
jgi:hypothetical protein